MRVFITPTMVRFEQAYKGFFSRITAEVAVRYRKWQTQKFIKSLEEYSHSLPESCKDYMSEGTTETTYRGSQVEIKGTLKGRP